MILLKKTAILKKIEKILMNVGRTKKKTLCQAHRLNIIDIDIDIIIIDYTLIHTMCMYRE